MVPLWMLSNAIACGNTFILKPSEKVPSTSVYLASLAKEAGVPDGVLNIVHGDKVAVDRLLDHPDVRAISFVGSTPIARYIYETGTRNGKRVQALGGAKNHMLVLPDADINMAADAAVSAGYGAAGERCMAISVVVAVGPIAGPLIEAIRDRIAKIKVGPGNDAASEMGPLVSREHRDKVAYYIETASEDGATITVDGRYDADTQDPALSNGFFLGPSLLDNVRPGMRCYDNEIFGPVLSIVRVDTYAEALQMINDNPFGNGTAIFTQNGGAARQFQFDVEVGMVGINVPIPVPVSYYSFGGWKSSLFGDLHMYGPEGVQFYTRGKVVTSRWPDPGTSKVDLGFPQVR
jgi:malonate-semialdehyde dehydrogenase (acetylating)/methylmalonate-semialdehyde dehydrogenase